MNKKTAVRWLCGIVIVLILACLGQDLLLTDAGAVRVERLGWVTEDGAYLNSVLFVPRSATAQTPAPAVITCHGYNNTTGDMENNNLELARRGYVVITIDMYGHGSSTYPEGVVMDDDYADGAVDGAVATDYEGDALVMDGGVYSALQYLGGLPYVDRDHIGIIGHSGGGMSIQFGAWRALARHQQDPTITVPWAILVSCEGADAPFNDFAVNVATLTPEFDEFGAGHWNVTTAVEAVTSPKFKQFFGFAEDAPDLAFDTFYSKGREQPLDRQAAVEAAARGELRVAYLVNGVNHPDVNYSSQAIGDVVDYFDLTLKGDQAGAIDAGDQVWLFKNLLGLVCLVCFFLMMLPVSALLLATPFFSGLVREPAPGAVLAKGDRLAYCLRLALGVLLPAALFYPLMCNPIVDKGHGWISATLWPVSPVFPLPIPNALCTFMLCITVLSALIYLFTARRSDPGYSAFRSAFRQSPAQIGKALLLSLLVLLASYLALVLAGRFFGVDFRFLLLNVMPVSAVRWRFLVTYLVFFAVYFLLNSFLLNFTVARREGREAVNLLLCVVFNAGGIFLLRIFDQAVFAATRLRPLANYSTLGNNSSMAYVLTLSVMFTLTMTTLLSRLLYKRYGNVWVSGFVCAMASTFCTICNTVVSSNVF